MAGWQQSWPTALVVSLAIFIEANWVFKMFYVTISLFSALMITFRNVRNLPSTLKILDNNVYYNALHTQLITVTKTKDLCTVINYFPRTDSG